jgi:hypothetical protein
VSFCVADMCTASDVTGFICKEQVYKATSPVLISGICIYIRWIALILNANVRNCCCHRISNCLKRCHSIKYLEGVVLTFKEEWWRSRQIIAQNNIRNPVLRITIEPRSDLPILICQLFVGNWKVREWDVLKGHNAINGRNMCGQLLRWSQWVLAEDATPHNSL